MREMKHVLEEVINYLDSYNAEYGFSLYDVALPLPGTGEEKHREIFITRTNKDGTGRLRIMSYNYTFDSAEKEIEAREEACEWMIFQLAAHALYQYKPEPKR